MTDESLNTWMLLPALVASISGVLAHFKGRSGWGVGIAIVGFCVVFAFAFFALLLGIVTQGQAPTVVIIWSGVAIYWFLSYCVTASLDPIRRD